MQIQKPSMLLQISLFALLTCFQAFFFYTYPLNIGAYDYPNYLQLLFTGDSNLIHAPGYPLIFRAELSFLGLIPPANFLTNSNWLRQLQLTQVITHLFFCVGIYFLVKIKLGERVALLTLFLFGSNLSFIANVNSAAPEWLQGDLAIISFLLLFFIDSRFTLKKISLTIISAIFLSAAYLVKYNTLLLVPAFLVLLLFLSKSSWLGAMRTITIYVVSFLAIIFLFANTYHLKSTGTTKLSYDHAWVLTHSLSDEYLFQAPQELGPHTLRLIALVKSTPSPLEIGHAVAIQNIEWGPDPAQRELYKNIYDQIMAMSHQELIEYIDKRDFPAGYSRKFAVIPLYYYYGLSKTDELGTKVYMEALFRDPIYFLKRSTLMIQALLMAPPSAQPYPVLASNQNYEIEVANPNSSWVNLKYNPSLFSPLFANYYNPSQKIFFPGVKFFNFLNDSFLTVLSVILYSISNLLILATIFIVRPGKSRIIYLSILFGVATFVICSTLILGVRSKEGIFITPFYTLLVALAIFHCLDKLFSDKAVNFSLP